MVVKLMGNVILAGKLWQRGVYTEPNELMVQLATEQSDLPAQDRLASFISDEVVAKAIAARTPAEADAGTAEEAAPSSDIPPVDKTAFFDLATFDGLASVKQTEYVNQIKEAPEGLSDEEQDDYDARLFTVLNEYKEVAKAKSKTLIEDVLAEFAASADEDEVKEK